MIQGTDGNFYGTTSGGSSPVLPGTIFQMTPAGILRTLHTFGSGDFPSGLLQATDGAFYGTTSAGGNLSCNAPYGCGTVFRLDMGLPPFVAFVERAGRIGRTVVILGQRFTGATNVSFGTVSATFTVESDTSLIATVPAGASTGYVTVTALAGTLTSNVPFQVVP